MKNTIKIPGFTADAAALRANSHYRAADYPLYTSTVQPAIRRDSGLPCLKIKCSGFPFQNCHSTVGHVNPVTGRCE